MLKNRRLVDYLQKLNLDIVLFYKKTYCMQGSKETCCMQAEPVFDFKILTLISLERDVSPKLFLK